MANIILAHLLSRGSWTFSVCIQSLGSTQPGYPAVSIKYRISSLSVQDEGYRKGDQYQLTGLLVW